MNLAKNGAGISNYSGDKKLPTFGNRTLHSTCGRLKSWQLSDLHIYLTAHKGTLKKELETWNT
jgi:hypothetical protein